MKPQEPKKSNSAYFSSLAKLDGLLNWSEPGGLPPPEVCWTCQKCGPVAPLYLPTGRWIKRSCECQRLEQQLRKQEESRQEWLREQSLFTYGGWIDKKRVDRKIVREMCSKTFAGYDSMLQPEGFEKALAFAREPKGNLLLYGDFGTGKTHLEAAICNAVRETVSHRSEAARESSTSVFVSAPRFFREYEAKADQGYTQRLLRQVMNTSLLILDDIDKSRATESRWETYWLIFDERYRARRPTVLSMNRREELVHYIGAAALSRLSRGLVAAKMFGDDYRPGEI